MQIFSSWNSRSAYNAEQIDVEIMFSALYPDFSLVDILVVHIVQKMDATSIALLHCMPIFL